jgi:RNA polymerase sigma-B factor
MPTIAELADAADLTKDQVLDTMAAARNYTTVSLDAPIDEERSELDLLGGREPGYEQVEHHLQLLAGMKTLRQRERRILAMRFAEGLTQSEIAAQLGISQMHVSRLLRQALTQMAEVMRDEASSDQPVLRHATG